MTTWKYQGFTQTSSNCMWGSLYPGQSSYNTQLCTPMCSHSFHVKYCTTVSANKQYKHKKRGKWAVRKVSWGIHLEEYISALTLFRSCWPMWGCGPQNGNSLCVCGGGREALAPHESWGCRIQRQTLASEAFWMAVTTVGASDRSACREGFGRIPGRGQMPEAS